MQAAENMRHQVDTDQVEQAEDACARDAEQAHDRICFFDELLDVTVDGERRERPVTPWTD